MGTGSLRRPPVVEPFRLPFRRVWSLLGFEEPAAFDDARSGS